MLLQLVLVVHKTVLVVLLQEIVALVLVLTVLLETEEAAEAMC
jgi:hypothetical protein